MRAPSATRSDVDLLDDPLRFRPGEIDGQKTIDEFRSLNLHSLRQEECALELPGGDSAMQEYPLLVLLLPPSNEQLPLLERDLQLILGEAGDGERDPEPLRRAVGLGQALYVVRRIAVGSAPGNPVEGSLDIVEAQKKRRIQTWYA